MGYLALAFSRSAIGNSLSTVVPSARAIARAMSRPGVGGLSDSSSRTYSREIPAFVARAPRSIFFASRASFTRLMDANLQTTNLVVKRKDADLWMVF